jgi:hypothetical protein
MLSELCRRLVMTTDDKPPAQADAVIKQFNIGLAVMKFRCKCGIPVERATSWAEPHGALMEAARKGMPMEPTARVVVHQPCGCEWLHKYGEPGFVWTRGDQFRDQPNNKFRIVGGKIYRERE